MCLIVLKNGAKAQFTNKQFKYMIARNPHGLGFMTLDENDRVVTEKCMGTDEEKFEMFRKYRDRVFYVMHSRIRTHGEINEANCHPYEIMNKDKGDPYDLYMMHNGMISEAPDTNKKMSDTWHWVEYVLKPLVKADPEFLWDNEYIQKMIAKSVGASKLVFLRSDNPQHNLLTLNKSLGSDVTGCWLSNGHGATPFTTTTTTTVTRGGATGIHADWERGIYDNWAAGRIYNYKLKIYVEEVDRLVEDWDKLKTPVRYTTKEHLGYKYGRVWDKTLQKFVEPVGPLQQKLVETRLNPDTGKPWTQEEMTLHAAYGDNFMRDGKLYLPKGTKTGTLPDTSKIVDFMREKKQREFPLVENPDQNLIAGLSLLRQQSDDKIKEYMKEQPEDVWDIINGLYRKNTMTYEHFMTVLKTAKGREDMVHLIRLMEISDTATSKAL